MNEAIHPHLLPNPLPRPARDRSRQAAPQVFEYLREQIVTLVLPPGAVLPRAALQDLFGVSSTPVRDALMRLEEEGLVEVFPQHATRVSPIDLGQARRTQFLRRAIEQEAVRLLSERPERAPALAALETVLSRQRAMLAAGDLEAFDAADRSFHATLCELVEASEVWALVRRSSGHIDRLRRLNLPLAGKAPQIIRDHEAIVAGIAAGDPATAQAAVRDHLSRSLASADHMRRERPDYFRD
ncbi:MAG: GntR family transcriptional regulator [Rhizobiales bacterium 17-65-6]|nr:MAG: GntR family transcriptional regulator [Rhizobiales bacterium 12-68-15]OYX86011.1 MAG: GntR family transcriptional regulator [Azorhizobium sp. 32-67-21]OYY07535.1 MAG: GntR family transcriptional regulator [Rhizobiales bacterium 35-68-8]OZA00030.1 MAG: GntR family transcriptional regulator [Rhizobiales bacterium 17-65-6]